MGRVSMIGVAEATSTVEAVCIPIWTPLPPQLNRWRPKVGMTAKITDAELITVAVMQALRGFHDEARWIRYARNNLRHLFPCLPKQPGYNKRLRLLVP